MIAFAAEHSRLTGTVVDIDEYTSKSEFIMAKNRSGSTATINLIFKRDISKFEGYINEIGD